MGKLPTLSAEDFMVLLLALLIVFGPAVVRLLAALMTFRTSGRLRTAARILDRLIRETEERRARRQTDSPTPRRMLNRKTSRRKDGRAAAINERCAAGDEATAAERPVNSPLPGDVSRRH